MVFFVLYYVIYIFKKKNNYACLLAVRHMVYPGNATFMSVRPNERGITR